MDNQHKLIKGYRDLSQAEIDLMNEGKELQAKFEDYHSRVRAQIIASSSAPDLPKEEVERINRAEPLRWLSIGRTHFQEGMMATVRAIAQPGV
jgi:hypothetical protein